MGYLNWALAALPRTMVSSSAVVVSKTMVVSKAMVASRAIVVSKALVISKTLIISGPISLPKVRALALTVVLPLLGPITGCSNQSTYSALQQRAQQDCQTEPPGAYEACLERNKTPYSIYEQEREAVMEADDAPTRAEPVDETLAAPVIEQGVE